MTVVSNTSEALNSPYTNALEHMLAETHAHALDSSVKEIDRLAISHDASHYLLVPAGIVRPDSAEAVADRPKSITPELFIGRVIIDIHNNEQVIDDKLGRAIHFDLIVNGYIDKIGALTDKYYDDKSNGLIQVADEVSDSKDAVIGIIDSIYDVKSMQFENARSNNIELQLDEDKVSMPEFKALWEKINL